MKNPDPGSNIAEDPKLDPVIEHGVSDQLSRISLKQVDPINGYGGNHVLHAVRLLVEPRHGGSTQRYPPVHDGEPGIAVPDPNPVGVHHREEQPYREGERGGGGGCGVVWGDPHVLNVHLLEVHLWLLGLNG